MTVQELIDKLSRVEDTSTPVMVWDPYNDRATLEVKACMIREGRILLSNSEIGRLL
jgi:hypothetical protein